MAAVIRLAEQAVISKLMAGSGTGNDNHFIRCLNLLAGLLAFAGFGFLLYGAYLWLDARYSADIAALYTGLVSLLLMVLVIAAIFAHMIYRKQRLKLMKRMAIAKVKEVMNDMDDEIGEPIRNHPKTAVAISTLAGFLIGERL